jgi:hypothetical protein
VVDTLEILLAMLYELEVEYDIIGQRMDALRVAIAREEEEE